MSRRRVPGAVTDPAGPIDVRLGDGITVETPGLGTVRLDPRNPGGDVVILSHAHADHLPSRDGETPIVASELTCRLARIRRDVGGLEPSSHEAIELIPAGHIEGSRAALIEDDGVGILYTGDIATRDRYGLSGFEPPAADVLIIETTYGSPEYVFPPTADVEREVRDWLAETADSPAILFGYALGKAQRILRLLERTARDRIYTTQSVLELNAVIAEATGRSFKAALFDRDRPLAAGDVAVLPSQLANLEWVDSLVEESGAVTAGFSGWAADSGYVYQRGVDRGFVLSDHCDFTELIDVVRSVDPGLVYTHHGLSAEFATELTRRGFDARALRANQSTLDSF